jgi:hypothetical protein
MLSAYFDLLDSLSEKTASRLHFTSSTTAAVGFFLVAFGALPLWGLPIILIVDLSTAYTVIGGVNAKRYKNEIPNPGLFFKVHVIPGVTAYATLVLYILSLLVFPLHFLFWVFLPLWAVAYVTGAWAFFKLR